MSVESKRVAETQARRRRRTDTSYEAHGRLGVNEHLLDRTKFTYRWVNDDNGRIEALTVRDDWDHVRKPELKEEGSKNEGEQVRQLVGSKKDGSPLYAYLLQKPLEFHREDQARKHRKLDQIDAELKRGKVAGSDTLTDDPNAYVPSDGISLTAKTGRRAQESYTP